jgi:hypothetical protein
MLDKLQGKLTKIDLADSVIIMEIDTSGNEGSNVDLIKHLINTSGLTLAFSHWN